MTIVHMVHRCHFLIPPHRGDPSTPRLDSSHVNLSFVFKLEFKLINMSQSFLFQGSQSSLTPMMPGRISSSRATFHVATITSSWIMAATRCRLLAADASRSVFEHSSPTAGLGLFADVDVVGTLRNQVVCDLVYMCDE
jgi:hypothetical protein